MTTDVPLLCQTHSPKLTAKGLYHDIDKQGGKPRYTAWARNGATNVKHLALSNLDCQSLKDER